MPLHARAPFLLVGKQWVYRRPEGNLWNSSLERQYRLPHGRRKLACPERASLGGDSPGPTMDHRCRCGDVDGPHLRGRREECPHDSRQGVTGTRSR